ncbi:MAG: ANTAR domain-containing response regulator [Pirellulaceae bacterium]
MSKAFRVIVADDESDLLESYQAMLRSLGHEVVAAAHSGEQLIQRCRELCPDLVISDIKMPGKDGIEAVLEAFGESPMRVILVTGYHAPDHIHDALGQMVLAYLAKPFTQSQLLAAIGRSEQRFAEFQALLDDGVVPGQAVKRRELLRLAKGVLMKKAVLSDREAFVRLKQLAEENRVSLAKMAKQVVDAEQSLHPAPDSLSRSPQMPNYV